MGRILNTAILTLFAVVTVVAQEGAKDGEWHHYGGDQGHSRYSPLDQIDKSNVSDLQIAWRWESVSAQVAETNRRVRPGQFKVTPLMIDGVLYASTGISQVVAIDPATGETIWVHDPKSYERGRPANTGFQHRGIEYWTDGEDQRLIIATGGRQLVALDLKTGKPIADFGDGGEVDLGKGLGRNISESNLGFNAPVTVCRDTIVVGSIVSDAPTSLRMPPGHVRGYDVRTGEMKWVFHTIPQRGEYGVETWEGGSWRYSGNTNVWATISCDEELGYVYLPTSTPTNDWYGGHRKGDNLFAESIVCLNAETGERVWHFQAVHHGLWDYDFPCAANLCNITVDGKQIKALAQVSKQGFTYVFDRATGEPVWPIEEREVPQSDVPGEQTSPTQPFPTKPPAFERQTLYEDDLIDFTPELREEAKEILSKYLHGPMFVPPLLRGTNGYDGTVFLPSAAGGANWSGACFDPETSLLYVPSMTLPMHFGVTKPDADRSPFDFVISSEFMIRGPQGLPLCKPPYGRVTAIDLNRGEHAWQVPLGDGPRDHPAIKHLNLGRLGNAANGVLSNGGGVLTKTLYFVIQAEESNDSIMRMGKTGFIRAFDKANGDLVWEYKTDATPHGTPMTYMHEGKQYIVMAVGGGFGQTPEFLAFRLP